MPGKIIAQLMGHAKVDTTLNIYAQVLDGSVREAAERVGRRLITIDHSAPEVAHVTEKIGSSGWIRTSNPPVNRLTQVMYLVDSSAV